MSALRRCGLVALGMVTLLAAEGCGRIGFQGLALSDDGGPGDARVGQADGEIPGDGGGDPGADGGADTGVGPDATVEAGIDAGPIGPLVDAGGVDAGVDSGADAGGGIDAGVDAGSGVDAGIDAGSGVDAGSDSGTGVDAGSDSGTGGLNLPPIARFFADPSAGTTSTVFQFNASASSDPEDATNALAYDWDWNADGVLDGSGMLATHTFSTAGHYVVWLAVTDSGGLRTWTSKEIVVVAASSDLIIVTTAVDEATAGATPAMPFGMGLSLREAVAYAEATAGKQTILVPSGMAITLATSSILLSGTNTEIVAYGARLTGAAGGQCVDIPGNDNFVAGLEITGCSAQPVRLSGTGNTVMWLHVHDNSDGIQVLTNGNTIGPGNEIDHNTTAGIDVLGTTTVIGNSVHDNTGPGLFLNMVADGSIVIGNFIYANGDRGLMLGTGLVNPTIVHNTIDSNGLGGVLCSNTLTGLSFRNNIISRNQGWGMDCNDSNFVALSHVDYYQNTTGTCTNCTTLGPGALTVDPGYMDAMGFDLRLHPTSMLIDAGVDLGYDRNDRSPGLFNGTAPDIGAYEAP